MQRPINAIVFDIGGVLLDWNPGTCTGSCSKTSRIWSGSSARCALEWHDAHDRGKAVEVSCAELAATHPAYSEQIFAWGRRSEEMVQGPIPETVELLRELKDANVPCYALTNMEVETYPQRVERFPFLRCSTGPWCPGSRASPNPTRRSSSCCSSGLCLAAESTLLVDDSPRNVRAALCVGMQAVPFRSAAQLREVLVQAGVLAAA